MFETIEIREVKTSIGKLIKAIRKKNKTTQIELAQRLDVSVTTIRNLESGKNFTIDTLLKIIKEYDLLNDLNKKILQKTNLKSLF